MKTTVALLIALVTLLPHSANATTLTITSGSIDLNFAVEPSGGGVPSLMLFGGDDFFVQQGRDAGVFGTLSPAFGVEPFVQSIQIYSSLFFGFSDVRVGTEHCHGDDFVHCGEIKLTSPGLAMPADWPSSIPFVATVPFTATGQLLVGGNQYDMVGQGTVTGTRCLAPCAPYSGAPASLAYTFSVGESPSLVLTLVSTIAIGIAFLVHRRSVVKTDRSDYGC